MADDSLDVPRDEDGVETWDLREPPTAEYVGLEEGLYEASYSTLEPRRVRLLLPEGRVIDAELTVVSFNNLLSGEGVLDPSGMNLHGRNKLFVVTKRELRGHLADLGMSEDAVAEWEAEIEASTDERPVEGGDSTTVGYMEIAVGGRYKFQSGNASLSWGAGWGPGMDVE